MFESCGFLRSHQLWRRPGWKLGCGVVSENPPSEKSPCLSLCERTGETLVPWDQEDSADLRQGGDRWHTLLTLSQGARMMTLSPSPNFSQPLLHLSTSCKLTRRRSLSLIPIQRHTCLTWKPGKPFWPLTVLQHMVRLAFLQKVNSSRKPNRHFLQHNIR